MQIKIDNVEYKKLKKLNFTIEDNKITGIVSDDIYSLYDINYLIKNNVSCNGSIKYGNRYNKKNISFLSAHDIGNIEEIKINKQKLKEIDDNILNILEINQVLNKSILQLSITEKIKLALLKAIIDDTELILIDGILEILDSNLRKNIIKLLISLKKFKNKTIVVTSIDIDIIYEFVDNIVLIINNESITGKNKYDVFDNIDNSSIYMPYIRKLQNMVYDKKNINLGNNDNINELIKSIYREIR